MQSIDYRECVGQVASQTLDSIQVISDVAQLPILRPLVMFDKNDIIAMAEKMGLSIFRYDRMKTAVRYLRRSTL
jgi:adenylyl- and sulfurtransferase ThiI